MTPTVSIVMAAKNYARFLPAAVESVHENRAEWERQSRQIYSELRRIVAGSPAGRQFVASPESES